MMPDSPIRTLFVGHCVPGDSNPTGNTLAQIFQGSRKIDFLQYVLDYDPSRHGSLFRSVYISPVRSWLYYLLKRLYRNNQGSSLGTLAVAQSANKANPMVELAKAATNTLPVALSRASLKEVDAFRPQVVYTLCENITTLAHAVKMSERYQIPIVCHMMDDLETTIYSNTAWTSPWRRRYLRLLNKAMARSVVNLAISPTMAREYEQRHGKPFSYAMNCIEETHPHAQTANAPMRMVFSGGLHGGRADSVAAIANAIRNTPELAESLRLSVYTSDKNIALYGKQLSGLVELAPYVPREQMYENLGSADILLHVESFTPEERAFFRLSMSTKLPEYMSVGRPIFCYGPSEICTVSYIRENHIGVVAEEEAHIREALLELVTNAHKREQLGNHALELAEKEHLKAAVSERVYQVFRETLTSWQSSAS